MSPHTTSDSPLGSIEASSGLETTISSGTKNTPLTERSANATALSSSETLYTEGAVAESASRGSTSDSVTERSASSSAASSSDSSTSPEDAFSTDKVPTIYGTSAKHEASTTKDATASDNTTEATPSGDPQGSCHFKIIGFEKSTNFGRKYGCHISAVNP